MLVADRTWTAAQLAAALGEHGIVLSTRQMHKYLRLMGARWRRMQWALRHKRDPARVARATAVLGTRKNGRSRCADAVLAGCVRLCAEPTGDRQLDTARQPQAGGVRECPVTTRQRTGGAECCWHTVVADLGPERGSLVAAQFVAFLGTIPRPAEPPLVIVLDNGSVHVSHVVKAAGTELQRRGIYLYFLPPYSPELNRSEPVFKAIKHYDLPEQRYTTWAALEVAIDTAFARHEQRLVKSVNQPGYAA